MRRRAKRPSIEHREFFECACGHRINVPGGVTQPIHHCGQRMRHFGSSWGPPEGWQPPRRKRFGLFPIRQWDGQADYCAYCHRHPVAVEEHWPGIPHCDLLPCRLRVWWRLGPGIEAIIMMRDSKSGWGAPWWRRHLLRRLFHAESVMRVLWFEVRHWRYTSCPLARPKVIRFR